MFLNTEASHQGSASTSVLLKMKEFDDTINQTFLIRGVLMPAPLQQSCYCRCKRK